MCQNYRPKRSDTRFITGTYAVRGGAGRLPCVHRGGPDKVQANIATMSGMIAGAEVELQPHFRPRNATPREGRIEEARPGEEHSTLTLAGGAGIKTGDRIEIVPSLGATRRTSTMSAPCAVRRGHAGIDTWPILAGLRSR